MEGKDKVKPLVSEEEKPERAPARIRGFRYPKPESEPKTEVKEAK
jgi:hypothetical protein